MSLLAAVKEKILAGQVQGLEEDIKKVLSSSHSGWEGKHIIRSCSKFVYENQGLEHHTFAALVDIITLCCHLHQEHILSDPFFHIKSLYYILLVAKQRKELVALCVPVAGCLEAVVEVCDASHEETHTTVRRLHAMLWNASLTAPTPLTALTLHTRAFQCTLVTGGNLGQVCDQIVKVHQVYREAEKHTENSSQYFQAILKYLTQALSKQCVCSDQCVASLVAVVMEYAKVVVEVGSCVEFTKWIKLIVKLLEQHCDSKMLTSLKAGLKLSEMAIKLRVDKCGGDMLKKLLGSCGMVAGLPGPNTVLILGLLTTLGLLHIPECCNLPLATQIVEVVMKRCRVPVSDDVVTKITVVFHHHLTELFHLMTAGGAQTVEPPPDFFTHMLTWASATKPFALTHLHGDPVKMRALYNLGIHFCNFGSMAHRKNNFDVAAKLLEASVDFFEQYHKLSPPDQKMSVHQTLTKRVQLHSEVLRYGGHYWEAGVAAARGFLMGCLTTHDLVTLWAKCRRDAKKKGSDVLKKVTVCDAVMEAGRTHQPAENVVFDQDEALLLEIQSYKQQKYNTAEEQLLCGRVVGQRVRGPVVGRVKGLLAVVEALWANPDMETQEQEAMNMVEMAKKLLQEAKSGGNINQPILQELEALVNFWQYLCVIQVMYTQAEAKLKEARKESNLFTTQLPEPGEEKQLHEECEGRPIALLSLYAQHASLTPLHHALDIWDKFVMQNLSFDNASVACASLTSVGYIYQLSGLDACTIRAWGLLISVARRHHLQHFLIRGIVELILTAPELVDGSLLEELEEIVSRNVPSKTQDTSQACLLLSASAATAFLYYKTQQYEAGARLIRQALQSEVLVRSTIRTTEVQAVVHLVASLYALLPAGLLDSSLALPDPCFSLALLACREAHSLVVLALTDSNSDIICWRHRVAGLLFTTTSWLVHLSINTAQSRMARAYLETSMDFSQQLILPLRIAQFLELSARVDVLCDQLEDCRVKIDSLKVLLVTHATAPHQQTQQDLVPQFTKLAITNTSKIKKKIGPEIFCDTMAGDRERMRTDSGTHDFNLKHLLPTRMETEPAERGSLSPTVGHLENAATAAVKFSSCPSDGAQCVLCTTPIVHHLRVSLAVLLALLHAHGKRFLAAQKCLDQAQSLFVYAEEVSVSVTSFTKQNGGKDWLKAPNTFIRSRLSLAQLQLLQARAECLALEGRWQEALTANLEGLKILSSYDTQLLVQNLHHVCVLSLQGQALEEVIRRRRCAGSEQLQDVDQQVLVSQKSDVDAVTRTTPEMKRKTSSKATQNLLNAPKHIRRKNLRFDIHSEEEEEEDSAEPAYDVTPNNNNNNNNKLTSHKPNKFFKSKSSTPHPVKRKEKSENTKILDSLETDWNDTLATVVLKVPSDVPRPHPNGVAQYASQPDSASLGGPAAPPKRSSKIVDTTGNRRPTGRGKKAVASSQNPEDLKPPRETTTSRGRSRATASSSASKAKVAPDPKPPGRTRASRTLRLV